MVPVDMLDQLYKSDLQFILRANGFTGTGNKHELIERVLASLSLSQALNSLTFTDIKALCSFFDVKYQGKQTSISALCELCGESSNGNKTTNVMHDEILSIQKELNNIVGLVGVKRKIKELIAFSTIQQKRKKLGLESVSVGRHIVFTGNPGTGKTTVARIIGRLFKAYGLVSQGGFREVKRSDLVGEYIGKSEKITSKILEEAKGGVLFIDEAYALAGENNDFGKVVIETLMVAMENYRDDIVIIVAGYKEEMEQFLNMNPGLKSRFNFFIEFDDYNDEELVNIVKVMAEENDYSLEKELEMALLDKFLNCRNSTDKFANGRLARNLFESMLLKQAIRLSETESYDDAMLQLLTIADL
ncbi:AAA family ATPase [Aeromonas veronii]|uniref:AAA family ATPase n=1 Tax=Aeromonas veronii TaxID=654 RepID=UPI00191C9313|nr:AAA family ATPase [Aeromonas veronii]MBL0616541.1 AAA family ATPase [Aeromonas veronii]MBO0398498.1 AAA family ATPase [Aeromonas veronii]